MCIGYTKKVLYCAHVLMVQLLLTPAHRSIMNFLLLIIVGVHNSHELLNTNVYYFIILIRHFKKLLKSLIYI